MQVKIAKKECGCDTHSRARSERKKQVVGDYRGIVTIDGDVLGIARQMQKGQWTATIEVWRL